MLTGRDDVRFQGKTGSSRPTAKVTRLTQTGSRPQFVRVHQFGIKPEKSNVKALR